MSEAGFTKGPWEMGGIGKGGQPDYVYCDDATGSAICKVRLEYVRRTDAENDANARLIAAAPDLFAALEAVQMASREEIEFNAALLLVERALAKALGR